MNHRKPTELFFAGTDTEVGKTFVASLAARTLSGQGKRVGVYKPVASGCYEEEGRRIAEDAVSLWEAAGRPKTLEQVCPQRFLAPLAPPEAAALEDSAVNTELFTQGLEPWREDGDFLLIEGAGGLFSPLAEGVLNIDLIKQLNVEVILVAANRLGVIHQTLACIEGAARRGVIIKGIVLNDADGQDDPSKATNAEQIARYCNVPILDQVRYNAERTCALS
ncbi:MAG: dethiobiotin synthase [Planctomycetota bacterium]